MTKIKIIIYIYFWYFLLFFKKIKKNIILKLIKEKNLLFYEKLKIKIVFFLEILI